MSDPVAGTIAYLTSVYARAGDTFIRREVEELRKRGWTVHTFSVRRASEGDPIAGEVLREQRSTDYILEHGPLRLLASFALLSIRFPARMLRAIRLASTLRWPGVKSAIWHGAYLLEASYLAEQLLRRRVSLLHDHISMNSATVALLASTISDIPFSMTVHGYHDFMAAEQWALRSKILASAMTICVSDFTRSQCMVLVPVSAWNKLHVIRCGLDASYLEATPSPLPDVPRLLCVGRLSPEKGQVILPRAVAALRDRGIFVEIVLVGDGPSRQDIESEARRLGVADRVLLVGWQGAEGVHEWISRCRGMVLPSLAEGIPVALMEAMALARPVIATHIAGIPELVRPHENGWLVPAGSVDELAAAMEEVLSTDPGVLREMGDRGRLLVLARHDVSKEVAKLADRMHQATVNAPWR